MKISEIGSLSMNIGEKTIDMKPYRSEPIFIGIIEKSEYEKTISNGVSFDILEEYEDGTLKVSYPITSCFVEV